MLSNGQVVSLASGGVVVDGITQAFSADASMTSEDSRVPTDSAAGLTLAG